MLSFTLAWLSVEDVTDRSWKYEDNTQNILSRSAQSYII